MREEHVEKEAQKREIEKRSEERRRARDEERVLEARIEEWREKCSYLQTTYETSAGKGCAGLVRGEMRGIRQTRPAGKAKGKETVNTTLQMPREYGAKTCDKMATCISWMNHYSMTTMRIGYKNKMPEKLNYVQVGNTARYGRQ